MRPCSSWCSKFCKIWLYKSSPSDAHRNYCITFQPIATCPRVPVQSMLLVVLRKKLIIKQCTMYFVQCTVEVYTVYTRTWLRHQIPALGGPIQWATLNESSVMSCVDCSRGCVLSLPSARGTRGELGSAEARGFSTLSESRQNAPEPIDTKCQDQCSWWTILFISTLACTCTCACWSSRSFAEFVEASGFVCACLQTNALASSLRSSTKHSLMLFSCCVTQWDDTH